jgi:dipeptidyl aminopeptidase/acylaminoacyl peptidase
LIDQGEQEYWFEGACNRLVHAWILKPHGYVEGRKYPLAFLIHGGPEGAWNDEWGNRWNPQIFAGAGFVGNLLVVL